MKIEYYEEMLEQEAINKYLNMIARDYNGELAKIFQEKYINKDKEIERLNRKVEEYQKYVEINHKEIERLSNIIKEIEKMFNHETLNKYFYGMSYEFEINDFKDDVFKIIKGSESNE